MQGHAKLLPFSRLAFILALALVFGLSALSSVSAQIGVPRDCPPNESYLACGPDCQTECATLNQPCLIRHIRCPDGCYCNEGYARNAQGGCIPIKQCPNRGGGQGKGKGKANGNGKHDSDKRCVGAEQ